MNFYSFLCLDNQLREKLLEKRLDRAGIRQADRRDFACIQLHNLVGKESVNLVFFLLMIGSDRSFTSALQSKVSFLDKGVVQGNDHIFWQ